MDQRQNEATNATTDETGPDDSEPTPERQAELRKAYEANVAVGKPPYAGVVIRTRGEVSWIVQERGWPTNVEWGTFDNRDQTIDFRLVGIRDAVLSHVDLGLVNLSGAVIYESDLSHTNLVLADLTGALVIRSIFRDAFLLGANLTRAHIDEGTFTGALLVGVNMSGALIVSGDFSGADLSQARMDSATVLGDTRSRRERDDIFTLDARSRLLDVAWSGALLAGVHWERVSHLGDELDIRAATSRVRRVQALRAAARAYSGLAKALEAQSLITPALRFRRRQHQLERAAQLRSFNLLGWAFSSALNIISGYGDRPLRALGVYLAVILAFAGVYFGITTPGSPIFFGGSQPLQLHEAVVFSLSSFHGRGFFPSTIGLGDPVAIVAALEAVVGLFIELVLIATFTRRLFER